MNLIAESDASDVVLALKAHQRSSTYVGYIIEDCISFNVRFHSLNLLHVRVKSTKLLII